MHGKLIIGTMLMLLAMARPASGEETVSDSILLTVAADTLPDDKETLRRTGMELLDKGDFAQAYRYGQRLLQLGEQDGDRAFAQLYGHLILALSGIDSERHTKSYAHLVTARTLAERYHDHTALMQTLNGFGHYALFVNDDAYSSISYYMQALEEARRVDNRRMVAVLLSNLSGAYFVRGDLSGMKYAEEAVSIAEEAHEQVPLFYGLNNLAFYHLAIDSLAGAAFCVDALEKMHASLGYGTSTDIHLVRAELCEKQHDINKAYAHYAQAMENFPTATPSSITMTYLKYAGLLRKDRHLSSAIRVLEHALGHIDESEVPIHKGPILKELSLCYREAGDLNRALDCALQYIERQGGLFDEIRERAMQEARIRHDIYSREQQISEQQVVILHGRLQRAVLTGLLAVLLLAFVMAYIHYRKEKRLYQAIVRQNSEYVRHEKRLLAQIEQMRAGGSAAVPADKLQDLMTRFTALMIEAKLYTDPSLTVASVAERLDTNRTYLSKAINEMTGKTFTQQVNEYRIRHAIAEISDLSSDKPLKQIASDAGFSSLSTFYTTFQNFTGMPPAKFRAQLATEN